MDRAWMELHVGSDITIPRVYRFIIKYVTPLFLLVILGWWLVQDWLPKMLLKGVPPESLPHILWTRILLVFLLETLIFMVWVAWKHRAARGEAKG
jgi:hypothetical protein